MLSVVPDSGFAPPFAHAPPGNGSEPVAAAPARNNCRRRSRRSSRVIFSASPSFPSILAEREILDKAPARSSPIYAREKYISVALMELLTFWLQSTMAGMGDRCRCGGLVGSGSGRRWRLKGSGRVQEQTPRLSGD